MKLCNKPKFKSTCDVINNARALVKTVHKSATLKQEWDRMYSLPLVGDAQICQGDAGSSEQTIFVAP